MRRARAAVAFTAVAAAFCLAAVAPASAAPVTMTFDHGRVSISALFQDVEILPATSEFPSEDLPLPQRTDIQLNGDLTGDQLTFSQTANPGTQFPYMHLMHPIEPGLMVPFTIRLNDPGLTGTYDAETGRADLAGTVDVIVVTGQGDTFPLPDSLDDLAVPSLGLFARCRIDDVPVSFSTANQAPFTGAAYADGLDGNGALTTSWSDLPDAVSENGGACDDLNPIIHGDGGMWLASGIVEPTPQPEPEPTCETDPRLCPPPTFTEIDGVRAKPKKRRVKAGKQLRIKVRVHNSGNVAAPGTVVRLKSSNRRVKVRKRIRLDVPAASWATATVKVKVKRRARGRARITASSHGWSNGMTVKVKPKKKPRRR